MKKQTFLIVLTGMAFALYAQNAESIVRDSRSRIKAETVSTRLRLVSQAKNGTVYESLFDQYSKDGPNGKRLVIVFQSPSEAKGTRILTLEKLDSENDCWIKTDFMSNSIRIDWRYREKIFNLGNPENNFFYDDIVMESRNASLDTHTLLREETVDGTACHVIQSVPKNSNAYVYSKMILYITKGTLITMKIELYNKDNKLIKIAEMSGLKEVQGHLITTVTKMTTIADGTFSTIFTDIIKYSDPVPDGVFTQKYLETGRL